MTKAELESKPLSDLHALAAESGVERFRMLSRAELIDALADGESGGESSGAAKRSRGERREDGRREAGARESGAGEKPDRGDADEERPRRRRRRRSGASARAGATGAESGSDERAGGTAAERPERAERADAATPEPPRSAAAEPETAPAASPPPTSAEPARPRRRRRRRFGRRGKEGVTIQDLLLPPEAGRQAILAADSAAACTALLRGVAADLAAESKGPDPVVLLIDPSPEELADWKREAPKAEIVAAGQARHADDALAQAATRAKGGEDVILLVDSLTRLASAYGDADTAKEFFDAGRAQAGAAAGSLTVVVALERPAS